VCTSISESPLLVVLVGILIHRRVCHTPPIDSPQDWSQASPRSSKSEIEHCGPALWVCKKICTTIVASTVHCIVLYFLSTNM
jgi:hypothetical protein